MYIVFIVQCVLHTSYPVILLFIAVIRASQYKLYAMHHAVSSICWGLSFNLLRNVLTCSEGWVGTGGGYSGCSMKRTNHGRVAPSLGISGSIHLLPPYTFTVCTRTALSLPPTHKHFRPPLSLTTRA